MNLDLEKIWTNLLTKIQDLELEKLWSNWEQLEWADLLSCWESLDAITKIVLTMMFTNYFILSLILGITLNLYGYYLLDRFQLEKRYPKIAVIIKYRRKLSKYIILYNILLIILTCLMNIFFGISILSLFYL